MPLFTSRPVAAQSAPDGLPILSPGKHRSPRAGACFMEFASHLAGEKWSDHPSCTHPALGRLARLVNDNTSDTERSRLVMLVPAVVGVTCADRELRRRIDIHIAMRAATAALPIVTAERRNAMAVTVIRCSDHLRAYGPSAALDAASAALGTAPVAADWARTQLASTAYRRSAGGRVPDAEMTTLAVAGIRLTQLADSDAVLRELLETVIDECRELIADPRDRTVGVELVTR